MVQFENMEIDNGTVIDLDSISKEGVNYKITDLNGDEISNSMESRKADKVAAVSISLNTNLLELEVGEKQLLTVSFAPVNATNQKVVWDSSEDSVVSVNNDGIIAAITAGTAVITVSQGDLEQTCEITVKEKNNKIISGDVNGDGDVNSKDAVLLKKYLAGYMGLNIDTGAADVTGDGKIDSKDAVRFLKYLAGYNVTLGK